LKIKLSLTSIYRITPEGRTWILKLYNSHKPIIKNADMIAKVLNLKFEDVKEVLEQHFGKNPRSKLLINTVTKVINTLMENHPRITNNDVKEALKKCKLPHSHATIKRRCAKFR